MLPVIEAHCDYQRPARYDDEIEVRTEGQMLSPCGCGSPTRSYAREDGVVAAAGHTVHAAVIRPAGRAGCRRDEAGVRNEGARHRRGRLHRFALSAALLDRGAKSSASTASPTTTRGRQGSEPRRQPAARTGFRFVEARLQAVDLDALLDGVTHVFHLAAQAGVRSSGARLPHLHVEQRRRVAAPARGLVDRPLHRFVYASSSSLYGDNVAIPMREEALPQPVSPYGVTKLAAEQLCHLYYVNHGVPTISLRYFTVYGPRQRPDMAFHRFIRASLDGQPITLYGDGEQTRDFTFVADAVAATMAAGDRGVPGRAYNIGGGSRVSMNKVIDIIGRVAGRPLEVRREPAQRATCATRMRTRRWRGGPGIRAERDA